MNTSIIHFNLITENASFIEVSYTLFPCARNEQKARFSIRPFEFLTWTLRIMNADFEVRHMVPIEPERIYMLEIYELYPEAETRFMAYETYVKHIINLPQILEVARLKRKMEEIMQKNYTLIKYIQVEREVHLKFMKEKKTNSPLDIGFKTCSQMAVDSLGNVLSYALENVGSNAKNTI